MAMRLKLCVLAVFAGACFGQSPIIIGVRGGVPVNDAVQIVQSGGNLSSASNDYVVGPTFGIRLPFGLSIAADALYTGLNISANSATVTSGTNLLSTSGSSSTKVTVSASSWEFPVIARYTARGEILSPFIGAGVSVRHLSGFNNVGSFLTGSSSSSSSIPASNGIGFVIAGGLQLKLGPLHVSPELRYTHWGSNQLSSAFSDILRTNGNEGQVLVGVTF